MTEITPILEIPHIDNPYQDTTGLFDIAPNIYLQYHVQSVLNIGNLKEGFGYEKRYRVWVVDTSGKSIGAEKLYEVCDTYWSYQSYMTSYGLDESYDRVIDEVTYTTVTGYSLKSVDAVAASLTTDTTLQLDIRRKLQKYLQGYTGNIAFMRFI